MRDQIQMLAMAANVATRTGMERALRYRPRAADDVPTFAERLTVEWLTEALCREVTGARVVDFEITRGDDGTSSRRAIEVTYNEKGSAAGLPQHLFSKSAATLYSRLLLGVTDITEAESAFYNIARPQLELRSPRAYYAAFDRRNHRSFVLLEDLSVEGWTFPEPMTNKITKRDAEDMVAEMAHFHGTFWASDQLEGRLGVLKDALTWQVNLNRKVNFKGRTLKGLDRLADELPPELVARRDEMYPALMRSLELHRLTSPTLLHQDLHVGNWLRDSTGRMGLYDWQCVARGHWAADYSYALFGALEPDDARDWEEDLLMQYLEGLRAAGVTEPPTFDQAWLDYRRHALHGLVMGLFTLGNSRFEPDLQPVDYVRFACRRIAAHVAALDTIGALRD